MNEYVFISYKFEQRETAEKIKYILESNGITCWMAPESIPGGSSYANEIPKAIRECHDFVVVLSSMSQESQYVVKEIDTAIKHKKTILPFVIEDFRFNDDIDFYLTNIQVYFANQSWESAIEKLVREIRYNFSSIDVERNPWHIVKDMINIECSLPHVLNEGFILFNRYEIKELLGIYFESSQQYRAFDNHLKKEVLISYIDRTLPYKNGGDGISKAGSFFQHQFIASAIDEYSNESYYVRIEPFYDVESLSTIIENNGPQTLEQVLKWAIPVCDAMIYMNEEMHYVYGYMTSNNIRIQKNGLPILFDVSVAQKIGEPGNPLFFDVEFLPLEALNCSTVYPTIDIYSFGINVLYALTGKKMEFISQRKDYLNELLKELPKKIRPILKKCLAEDAKNRYQDFITLKSDLEHIGQVDNSNKKDNFFKRLFEKNKL